jgi:hypothetical protein
MAIATLFDCRMRKDLHSRGIQVHPFQFPRPKRSTELIGPLDATLALRLLRGLYTHNLGEIGCDSRMPFETVQEWTIGAYVAGMEYRRSRMGISEEKPVGKSKKK